MSLDRARIAADFARVVNMDGAELSAWLHTPESKRVGFKSGAGQESIGHASGQRIVEILRARNDTLSADDYAHMRKVVGYIARHSAQRPQNIYTSRWRYSLMNWGHDPLKEDER